MKPILENEGIHFVPFAKKSNSLDEPEGNDRHCIAFIVNTISANSYYEVYFLNSGFGTEYHKKLIDYTIKDDAIIKKSVDYKVMYYFLYFFIMTDEIYQFYHTALSILSNKDIWVKTDYNTHFKYIENELNTTDTYVETQQIGNCTFRSLHLGILTWMVFIKKMTISNFEDWTTVMRLLLIKSFLQNYYEKLTNDTNTLEYHLLKDYIYEIYSDIYLKLYSTNDKFNNLLTDINGIIDLININSVLKKKFPFEDLTIPNITFNPGQTFRIDQSNIETEITESPLTRNINNSLIELRSDKPAVLKYYNLFQSLSQNYDHLSYFTNYSNILGSRFNRFYYDINKLIIYLNNDFLGESNKTKILNPYNILFYSVLNSYASIIAKNFDLDKIDDYSIINKLTSDRLIPSFRIYDLTNKILNYEYIKGNYLEYLTTHHDSLVKKIFMGVDSFDILKGDFNLQKLIDNFDLNTIKIIGMSIESIRNILIETKRWFINSLRDYFLESEIKKGLIDDIERTINYISDSLFTEINFDKVLENSCDLFIYLTNSKSCDDSTYSNLIFSDGNLQDKSGFCVFPNIILDEKNGKNVPIFNLEEINLSGTIQTNELMETYSPRSKKNIKEEYLKINESINKIDSETYSILFNVENNDITTYFDIMDRLKEDLKQTKANEIYSQFYDDLVDEICMEYKQYIDRISELKSTLTEKDYSDKIRDVMGRLKTFDKFIVSLIIYFIQNQAEKTVEKASEVNEYLVNDILEEHNIKKTTQFNLNFVLKDIIGNPTGELRKINDIESLFPNYYLFQTNLDTTNVLDTIDRENIGENYNNNNHISQYENILDISLDEIYGLVKEISSARLLIQKYEKYSVILIYLYYWIDHNINQLTTFTNHYLINDILDDLDKTKDDQNTDRQKIERLDNYISMIKSFYAFLKDKNDISICSALKMINYRELSNTAKSDIYQYGILDNIIFFNSDNLRILNIIYNNKTIDDITEDNTELNKMIYGKELDTHFQIIPINNYYQFKFSNKTYMVYKLTEKMSEPREYYGDILYATQFITNNKYIIKYKFDNDDEVYTILSNELLNIPSILLNKFILSENRNRDIIFEKLNENYQIGFRGYELIGKIAENNKWSIKIIKEGKNYYLRSIDVALKIIQKTFLCMDLIEHYLVFTEENGESYIILIPEINTEYFIDVKNNRSYLNDLLIVSNEDQFYDKCYGLQNFVITKDATKYYINYLGIYDYELKISKFVLNIIPVDSYKYDTIENKYKKLNHKTPTYYNSLAPRVIKKKYRLDDFSYTNHHSKLKLLTVSFDIKYDRLEFNDLDTALDILYMTSSVGNYYFSKITIKYISTVLSISDLKNYENRFAGYYPYLNVIINSLKLNPSNNNDLQKLVVLNRNSPIDCKMSRSFFSVINSDESFIQNEYNKLAIAGLGMSDAYKKMFFHLGNNNKYINMEIKKKIKDKSPKDVEIDYLKERKNMFTFDTVNFNFICREICFDYTLNVEFKYNNSSHTIKKEHISKFLGYKSFYININNMTTTNDYQLSIINIGDQIKWDKFKIRNVKDYILVVNDIMGKIEESHSLIVTSYSYDKIEKDTIEEKDHKNLHTRLSDLDSFCGNKKYTLTDESKFKEIVKTYLMKKLSNIEYKIRKFDTFKRYIDTITTSYHKLMNNRKLAELLFYETLKMKYVSDLYKLGYNEDGTVLEGVKSFDLVSNINIYMNDLLNIPGYVGENFTIKTNTIFIFFDYYFNLNMRKNNHSFGTFIRKQQYDLVLEIINGKCEDSSRFHQLIMGAGKSSYIAPLLSVLLISQNMYPIHIMPAYLIEQAKINMGILEYFGINNKVKEISRQDETESLYSLNEISGDNKQNINFIMSDNSLKSILLNNVGVNDIISVKNLLNRLKNCFIIMDEVDDISDPFKCELNFPNTSYDNPSEMLEEKIDLYVNILKLFYIKEYRLGLHNLYEDYEMYDDINSEFNIYYINRKIDSRIMNNLLNKFKPQIINIINGWLAYELLNDSNFDLLISETKFHEESKKKLTDDMSKKLFIVYNFFFNIMTFCMSNINRRNFGLFDTVGNDRSKYNIFAVPFTAVETPNVKSEFSNIDITLTYTIISYLLNKDILRKGDYDIEFREIYKYYNTVSNDVWITSDLKLHYNNLCKCIIGQTRDYDIDTINSYNTSIEARSSSFVNNENIRETQINVFREYLKRSAKSLIKEYKYQLNSTFSDIVSSDFCPNRTGFSGTPYFVSPIDKNIRQSIIRNPHDDKSAEGSIIYSIINSNVKIFKIDKYEDIFTVLSNSEANKTEYNAFIDVGAYCLGYSNRNMALKFIKRFTNISHCIYLDERDKKRIIDRNSLEKDQSESDKLVEYLTQTEKNSIEYLFVFFDQKHITGIDIPLLPNNAKGLVSLKYTNSVRDYSQGAFRLRKINLTQSVDICIDSNIAEKINMNTSNSSEMLLTVEQIGGSKYDFNTLFKQKITIMNDTSISRSESESLIADVLPIRDSINILQTSDIVCRYKLMLFLFDAEMRKKNQKTRLQALHNMRSIFRYTQIEKGINRLLFSDEFPNLGINIFTTYNSIPLPDKIDIDFSTYTITEKYLAETEYMIKIMNEIGLDNEFNCIIEYLYHEICLMRAKSKINHTLQIEFSVHEKTAEESSDLNKLIRDYHDVLFVYPEIYDNQFDEATIIENAQKNTDLRAYNIYNKYKNPEKFNTFGLPIFGESLTDPFTIESDKKKIIDENIELIIKSAIIGNYQKIKLLKDGISEQVLQYITTSLSSKCSEPIIYNSNKLCIKLYSDEEVECTFNIEADESDIYEFSHLGGEREAVAEQTQISQQENTAERQNEIEIEQELEKLSKNLKDIFDKLKSMNKFYSANDLFNPKDKKMINDIKNADPNETLINFGFSQDIVFTKLYLFEYYYRKLNEDINEIYFRVVYQKEKNLFIIMTLEEYSQLFSIWNRASDELKRKIDIHLDYNKLIIPGMRTLIDYLTDKNINDLSDLYPMIGKLLKYDKIDLFKSLSYQLDNINGTNSSEVLVFPKIKELKILKLIIMYEKYYQLTGNNNMFDRHRDIIYLLEHLDKLQNNHKISLFTDENIDTIKEIIESKKKSNPSLLDLNIHDMNIDQRRQFKDYAERDTGFDQLRDATPEWNKYKLFLNMLVIIDNSDVLIKSLRYYLLSDLTISTCLKGIGEIPYSFRNMNYKLVNTLCDEIKKISNTISRSYIFSKNNLSKWSVLLNSFYHKTNHSEYSSDYSVYLKDFREIYQNDRINYHSYMFNQQIYVNNMVEKLLSRKENPAGVERFKIVYPDSEETIYMAVLFDSKYWFNWNNKSNTIRVPDGMVQTICHANLLPKIRNADKILIDTTKETYGSYYYTRANDPELAGFGDTNYIFTMWQRA